MVEGDQITPNLRLVRPLRQPGASHVWLAHDARLACDVVVKVLDKPFPKHSPLFHRFQREADVAAHIQSPHVAKVLGHGVLPTGAPFLQMELLEGEDLAARLAREERIPLADVARIVSQLGKGIGKAHMLGLVHRNLNPTNVFLAHSSGTEGPFEVKVLDLGLSSRAEVAAGARSVGDAPPEYASADFASPEQVFGVKDVDFRADLWAIAVIAYAALTGRTPFRASFPEAFARAVEHGDFELPSRSVPSLPAALDVWFVKALQRDPASRFGGAKELADEFVRAAGLETHEGFSRPSRNSVGSIAPRGSNTALSARNSLSVRPNSGAPHEQVTIIGANRKVRSSSAVLIAMLALVGLGTLLVGLSLLHQW